MNKETIATLAQLAQDLAEEGRIAQADAVRQAVNTLGWREGFLTTGQAAERLGVSIPTIRRWAESGTLSGTNTGTRLLVSEESVERVLRIRRNLREMDEEGNPTDEELAELYRPRRKQIA